MAQTSGALDRLIYLASMRDYNTGLYVHQGLAARFSAEVACEALADCHQECFRELISLELKDLTEQLNVYMRSTGTEWTIFCERGENLSRIEWPFP